LFIVLSLFVVYLFLAGYAVAGLDRRASGLTGAAFAIAAGLLLNFCLMLTGQPMSRVLAAGAVIAAYGAIRLARTVRLRSVAPRGARRAMRPAAWLALAALLAVYYVQILSEPLEHWDARSIWFFHARMIWSAGALRGSAEWTHPSIAFSNPDYPKLVPALAAELACLKGFWNDYFPKGSLMIVLLPIALWTFSFWRARLSFVLILGALFFGLEAWLWNGYMDGFLIIYAGVALLLIGRYAAERHEHDLYAAICAAGIAANLKNEGLLFAVCFLVAAFLGAGGSLASRLSRLGRRVRTDRTFAAAAILSVAPTIAWFALKKSWGLESDLARNPLDGAARFWTRFVDGESATAVFFYLVRHATAIWWLAALLGLAVSISFRKRVRLHPGAIIAVAAALLYGGGLYVVYLSTPHDILDFYLATSATRTMATASMSLVVGLFFLLSQFERRERPASDATGTSGVPVAMVGESGYRQA
jgi:hypothetical protein